MTYGFPVSRKNDSVASTIADDRPVASIQEESLSFVLGDEFTNGLIIQRLLRLWLHAKLLDVLMLTRLQSPKQPSARSPSLRVSISERVGMQISTIFSSC